ncbi:MAG: GNAT family N-acetyltransferase [Methanomicrobiales archaeon]|nr:GNAT family N-acetyltransferase [Methanomicrobiales archaeon]MDI6876751.1 GNAT family N-acetyltransferase [Methanomicrobiales archaeon]
MGKTPDIEFRLVNTWSREEIVDLYRSAGWWCEEWDPAGVLPVIRGSYAFAVAVDRASGRAVGMGRVISDGVSDAYIQDLCLLSEYRRLGIGSGILSLLLDACRRGGIEWIGLIAEKGTEGFYAANGFRRCEGDVPMLYRGGE